MRRPFIPPFLKGEAGVGVILLLATVLALLWANSPFSETYQAIFSTRLSIAIGGAGLDKPILLWINDGLMAVFFLLVGLEIKREILEGELSSVSKASLPAIAAVGGMAVPALVYLAIASAEPGASRGWAIPAATDIAFAVGIMALLGSRVPASLRLFLLALAIIDDLGAIVIIAAFYTESVSLGALGVAAAAGVALWYINRAGLRRLTPYTLLGLILWVAVLKSGVHATLAGVALAMAIPLRAADGSSPLHRVENALGSWVNYAIIPLFALANAGVSFGGMTVSAAFEPVPLGIALGLIIGKPVGVLGAMMIGRRVLRIGAPEGASTAQVAAMAMLTGIGFTMSLFIGTLAFPDPEHAAAVRIGVLGGSLVSATLGYLVFLVGSARQEPRCATSG